MTTTTNLAATRDRLSRLNDYFRANLLDVQDTFICASAGACEASAVKKKNTGFYPVQGTVVGPHYDLTQSGVPLRVLVVPMETGRPRSHVSLEERTKEVLKRVGVPWRSWNPHMRGVGLALRLAFGHGLAEDDDGFWIDAETERLHVLQAYAMANLLLCSAVKIGTRSSRSTPVMRRNCLPHLAATIDILEPTLVISQGKTLSTPLRSLFTIEQEHSPTLATCALGNRKFVWADLYHPTRHWDWLTRPYLRDIVVPTLAEARTRALALANLANPGTAIVSP